MFVAMNYSEGENWMRQQLQTIYDEGEAASITALVLEHITEQPRMERMSKNEYKLSEDKEQNLKEITSRLLKHEPVQYILGEAYFAGLKLFVDRDVLIPRPETEELIHWIIEDVKKGSKNVFIQNKGEADATDYLKILDVGTGSGCIALSLKNSLPKAEVWGCDTSDAALNIARRNGSALDIRVDFVGLDFLDPLQRKQLPTVDIIVSNPPYIPKKESTTLLQNVVAYEPHLALFVPDNDALVFYKALAQFGRDRMYKNGTIYCEINEALGKEVIALFNTYGYNSVEIRKDMQGKNRMIKATYNE
ncbi:MAG TPA: peptide chain release factor N(5)-glutamine methyltransferase [Chitinophagaceae bacterium]|nr:peptide chain release factor N(5)-glutamine methyltransferase [Chitinophagaceae bacterium]